MATDLPGKSLRTIQCPATKGFETDLFSGSNRQHIIGTIQCPATKGFETRINIPAGDVVPGTIQCPATKGFETERDRADEYHVVLVRSNAPLRRGLKPHSRGSRTRVPGSVYDPMPRYEGV